MTALAWRSGCARISLSGTMPGMRLPCGVDHDGGDGEDIAAVAGAVVDALDGVADHAGDAVAIEAAIAGSVGVERAREHGDGIVAAIAVAGEGDAFFAQEEVDAGAVEGRAKGVGVEGLTPLVVGLLVAVAAVLGGGKGGGRNEVVALDGGVAGEGDVVGSEGELVGLADVVGVGLALGRFGC